MKTCFSYVMLGIEMFAIVVVKIIAQPILQMFRGRGRELLRGRFLLLSQRFGFRSFGKTSDPLYRTTRRSGTQHIAKHLWGDFHSA